MGSTSAEKVIIRTVATDEDHVGCQNYLATARNHEISDIRICGLGEPWRGWTWRTDMYVETLKEIASEQPSALVLLTDCYDVLINGTEEEIRAGYARWSRRTGKRVLIGAEDMCGSNCVGPIAADPAAKRLRYINAGITAGPAQDMLTVWTRVKANYERFGSTDDQVVFGRTLRTDTEVAALAGLDTRQDLVANITPKQGVWYRMIGKGEALAALPPIVHFPGSATFSRVVYNRLLSKQFRKGGERGTHLTGIDGVVVLMVTAALLAAAGVVLVVRKL